MKIKFNVTQEDIDQGTMHDCMVCPIGLAISRCAPDFDYFTNTDEFTFVDKQQRIWQEKEYPASVSAFIYMFDNQQGAVPFEAELEFEEVDG